jgi:hypothetical protein
MSWLSSVFMLPCFQSAEDKDTSRLFSGSLAVSGGRLRDYFNAIPKCSILELVRTHFGEKIPPPKNSERRRSRTDNNFQFFFGGIKSKNSQSEYLKNIGF